MNYLIIHETRGSHTRARVYAGPDERHFAFCGEFTMRNEEWHGFRHILFTGESAVEAGFDLAFRDMIDIDPGPERDLGVSAYPPELLANSEYGKRHIVKNSGPE